MAFNLFGKKKEKKETLHETPATPAVFTGEQSGVIKHFYVSEKSSRCGTMNQYVFKVAKGTTKPQMAALVSALYNVKVKDVKMLNMPRKRKDLGRYPGFRQGFRKAIVVLEKGSVIEQARA